MKELRLIVAYDRNRLIGANGDLPWHLPEDLSHFQRATLHHAVIMGRKTFQSIRRVLPSRILHRIAGSPSADDFSARR